MSGLERRRGEVVQPDHVDAHLRLLARALIETALQVWEEVQAAGVPVPAGAARSEPNVSTVDFVGASRYPPTP